MWCCIVNTILCGLPWIFNPKNEKKHPKGNGKSHTMTEHVNDAGFSNGGGGGD